MARRTLPGRALAAALAAGLIRRTLRQTFRRILWLGDRPWAEGALPPERPLVLYANHHYVHDGYLLWLLACNELRRQPLIWMRDWARAPLFGPLGALPFPEDAPRARLTTMRTTARRLQAPGHVFLYYPEGRMGLPDAGLQAFEPDRFARLARLFPSTTLWWPVAIHLTWWGEERPTALLTGGAPHDAPDGREAERLADLLQRLRTPHMDSAPRTLLLEGRRGASERWNLSPAAGLFARWT